MKESAKRGKGFTMVKWHSVKVLSRSKVVECERLYHGKVVALHSSKAAQWYGDGTIKCYYGEVRQRHVDDVRHVSKLETGSKLEVSWKPTGS